MADIEEKISPRKNSYNDVLHEALFAVLLGRTNVPYSYESNGSMMTGTIAIQSAFENRIRGMVSNKEMDDLIHEAMAKVTPEDLAKELAPLLAKLVIDGLGSSDSYGYKQQPNWLQAKAKEIAVEACMTALSSDDALKDRLRTMISAEVDRNRVGITVSLSDPEKAQ